MRFSPNFYSMDLVYEPHSLQDVSPVVLHRGLHRMLSFSIHRLLSRQAERVVSVLRRLHLRSDFDVGTYGHRNS